MSEFYLSENTQIEVMGRFKTIYERKKIGGKAISLSWDKKISQEQTGFDLEIITSEMPGLVFINGIEYAPYDDGL